MGIQINGQTDTISAVDGSITVATDLTVPGALTYDDVTNIDSVGVITARSGIRVTGGSVGIGTDIPAHKLHVSGTDANLQIRVTKEGVGSFNHGVDSTGAFLETLSTDNIPIRFYTGGGERLRIDSSGNVKIGSISDHSLAETRTPVYIAMQTDITAFGDDEGGASAGLVRIEEIGSNNNRYHGIELRNTNSGDIRFLNQDVGATNKGDLIIAMPDGDADVGLHNKIRFNSSESSIQISGKGGVTAGNTSTEHTDIYIATKTGVTAVNTGAGGEVAGLIRFEDKGSNNNRYHGIEIRNRNSGDARILNLDEGTTNKANLVFAVDNGSTIVEAMRIASSGNLGIGGLTNPGALLSIPAGESNTPRLAIESAVDDNDFTITQYEDGNGTYTMLGQNVKLNSSGNNTILDSAHRTAAIQLDARNHGNVTFYTGAVNAVAERLCITSNGSIGTKGLVPTDGSFVANSTIRSQNSSSNISYIGFTGYTGNTTVGSMFSYMGGDGRNTGYLTFNTNDTERVRITSDGKFGINTNSPAESLHIKGAFRRDHSTANVKFHEFSFALPDGATTTIATVSNPTVSSMAIAKFEYVGLYGYAGTSYYSGVEMASLRRSNNNSAYTYLQNSEIHAGGSNSSYQPNIFWQNGSNNTSDLMITTGTYHIIMGTIRITTFNLDFTRVISA